MSRSRAAVDESIVAATARCVTCGAQEIPSRSGNCRLVQDRRPLILPQTPSAERATEVVTELALTDPEALRLLAQTGWVAGWREGREYAEASMDARWAAVAATVRRIPDQPTHAELEAARAEPSGTAWRLPRKEWDDCVTVCPPEPRPAVLVPSQRRGDA